ncbi:sigma-70 family RNA polymerase sigma factor [Candidimonas sp. SYP-B2681]|uniref:sigma-70 family RNA polymerase sigma factor n=1 Tax=Candidimonas sp. SYP-B2681 TaxID=2497686 RepID=UPI000F86D6C0|nr:sigma-70 family RNA polymerase sigma factor [Candidimonas sp. SYP-B2681]RTZ48133.1 sigma-70 family RNA polymerase sigma factor [Candidimonas sp. SYP-B2681]
MSFESEVVILLPVLRRYAVALTGDAAWADDLVQDTVERALCRWGRWRSHSNVRAWLLTILRHIYIDQLRKRHEIATKSVETDWLSAGATEGKVDGLFLRDVQRALYQLPIDQREVLLLVGLEQLSYQEASSVLQIPLGTVMSRLFRAREHMHFLMHADDCRHQQGRVLRVVRRPR